MIGPFLGRTAKPSVEIRRLGVAEDPEVGLGRPDAGQIKIGFFFLEWRLGLQVRLAASYMCHKGGCRA
jgi:hypothetical protein